MPVDSTAFDGDMPHFYDEGLGPVLFRAYADRLATIVAAYAPARLLEISAGTGISSMALDRALPTTELTMTDLSPEMLELAAPRVPRASWRTADAQDLPFENGSFDIVACQFGVMFLPDLDAGFREAYRVLSVGGHYCISTWDGYATNPYAGIVNDLLRLDFPTDTPPFFQIPFRLHQIDELARRLQAVGFGDVRVTLAGDSPVVRDWQHLSQALVRANQTGRQIAARGGDPADFERRLQRALEQHYGPTPVAMPMQALFFEATKD
jgi:SAM-dependent methyltransferase